MDKPRHEKKEEKEASHTHWLFLDQTIGKQTKVGHKLIIVVNWNFVYLWITPRNLFYDFFQKLIRYRSAFVSRMDFPNCKRNGLCSYRLRKFTEKLS